MILQTAVVLEVAEDTCVVRSGDATRQVRFASVFPTPRVGRVWPAHLVALATTPDGTELVVWRWFDAVVLSHQPDETVRLWEPGHGEFDAHPREAYRPQQPGTRAYASAGLPGADWWVTSATAPDLDAVEAFYAKHNLWPVSP
jgi:hypothetical protein